MPDPIRVIVFGAHPDDCEYRAGGTAALWTRMGHAVKFVSMTNGDAGHHQLLGADLAARRLAETREVARRLGVEYDVLPFHDGQLLPTLEARFEVIRLIREWNADLVIGHRPVDYHPDHRYTGILLQDAAFMVVVPQIVPNAPPLRKNPVFLYSEDRFLRPNPFRNDISVIIDETVDAKIAALDAHVSQFYEWLPYIEGTAAEVPADPAARLDWLKRTRTVPVTDAQRETLRRWYGSGKATAARHCESFEICEYGAQPDEARIRELFPMLRA
jgi:LmbE family N-acetylglucosaminyl deacetylase